MVKYTIKEAVFMERLLIYALAISGIVTGLILFYRKPSPFGRKTYDKRK